MVPNLCLNMPGFSKSASMRACPLRCGLRKSKRPKRDVFIPAAIIPALP